MVTALQQQMDNMRSNGLGSALIGATDVRSTTDYVSNILRRAILTHQLKAGTRLVEAKTSKELNVSITPVRSAFAILSNQGLLTNYPYRGTYVTILSREYVEDIYYLRINLERMSAEKGFPKLTAEDIKYYEQLCELSDAAHDNNDLYGAIHYDMLFHEYLFALVNSSLMLEMWNTIKYRIENIQSYTRTTRTAKMAVRHAVMLEALKKRDIDMYIDGLIKHLDPTKHGVYFPEEKTISYK